MYIHKYPLYKGMYKGKILLILSEIVLTFVWILHQAYRWRPVTQTVYPDRLPRGDDGNKLPLVDVFICTADPSKEPSLGVMNTVISAIALDYPPDKLAVFQDDGGSHVTLLAMREAWKFARWWVPFVRKYGVKIGCPEAYFAAEEKFNGSSELAREKKIIEKRYNEFREAIEKILVNANGSVSRYHPPMIKVESLMAEFQFGEISPPVQRVLFVEEATATINEDSSGSPSVNSPSRKRRKVMTVENSDFDLKEMPLLVYVAREKRPGHPHHFKGGALNVLVTPSVSVISNAPYFLVLDCDMYCYDPSSARQAMCFYLDPKISPNIGGLQIFYSCGGFYYKPCLALQGLDIRVY
ncbi:cellulose synthase-like protein b4 [Phtheirospermum japonicum]|uniref:Cellulose synthase-like protein b4 n=1 Tax=Phtheirospermum japonicum TaxID=374723 RepID=A0A830BFH6_9LAMI|nr:cellulose synthase-like protein b4 [Phtheirospermum japonicum]